MKEASEERHVLPPDWIAEKLLEALRDLVSVYSLTGDHVDGHHGDDCALCKARAVIATAEESEERKVWLRLRAEGEVAPPRELWIILHPTDEIAGTDGAVNDRGVFKSFEAAKAYLAERETKIPYLIVRYAFSTGATHGASN